MDKNILQTLNDNHSICSGYPDEIKHIRLHVQNEVKNKLDIDSSRPIIVNGHQVEFFHPGILSKEILGATCAQISGGACLSIILDHDPHDLIFNYPEITLNDSEYRIKKKSYLLRQKSDNPETSSKDMQGWITLLKEISDNLKDHISTEVMENLRDNINILIENINLFSNPSEYITISRVKSLDKLNLALHTLKVSDLVQMEGWRLYCNLITNNLEKFILAHNDSLNEYRKEHKIKNHAQPVSNLNKSEVPFWVIENRKRRKAVLEDIGKSILYPRAITLSIFLRLFVSDLFIHGTGGARYDQVTNSIIRKFFQVTPSAFLVKTANLKLPLRSDSPLLPYRNVATLQNWYVRYRYFLFHPEKNKGADSDLVKERQSLAVEFHKNDTEKKQIHDALERNRIELVNGLEDQEDQLFTERDKIIKYMPDRNVLIERTFPYFFYDIHELINDHNFDVVEYK